MPQFVTVVVLNWNNASDTLDCLESLAHVTYPQVEIVAVDNGSDDGSVAAIRRRFPKLPVLETGTNLGYAGGNNVGIRHALDRGAELICVLNNDVLVSPGFLEPLVQACVGSRGRAVCTPMICEAVHPDRIWALGAAVDRRNGSPIRLHAGEAMAEWAGAAPYEVDYASGTAMLLPRQALEAVGLMDEAFFLYFEEMDWALRARHVGYRHLAVPSAVIWHKVSATLGQTSPPVEYYMLRNHLRFIARHWRGLACWRLMSCTVVRNLAAIAAYTLKPWGGRRLPNRNARLLALRDALLGRWGEMGPDVLACIRKP
jgi:GT2 family glycosyltransferase